MYHTSMGPVGDATPMPPIRAASPGCPPTTGRTLSFEISGAAPRAAGGLAQPRSVRIDPRGPRGTRRVSNPAVADLSLVTWEEWANAGTFWFRDRVDLGAGALGKCAVQNPGRPTMRGLPGALFFNDHRRVRSLRERADKVAWLRPGGRRILRQATTPEPNTQVRDEGKSVTKPVGGEGDKPQASGGRICHRSRWTAVLSPLAISMGMRK